MIEICGRKIKIAIGSKSQTINICTKDNQHGKYEFVIRLYPPFIEQGTIIQSNFASIDQLVRFLCNEKGGKLETQLQESIPLSPGVENRQYKKQWAQGEYEKTFVSATSRIM